MFKRKLTISDFLLIAVNLIPLYGVLFEGWDASKIFLVYCLETILIGIFNILKMAVVTLFVKPTDNWESNGSITKMSGFFFIAFFMVHYGFFVFAQTGIFFELSGLFKEMSYINTLRNIPQILGNEGQLMLLIFVAYYAVQMIIEFFFSGEYKKVSLGILMFQPYGRIFIQQFVVIIGSLFLEMGAGKIFILVFVMIRIFFELFVNFSSILKKTKEAKIKL